MPELLRFLLIALFSGWTFMAFLVAIGLLLPRFTDVSAQVLRTMPGRSFFVGVGEWAVFGAYRRGAFPDWAKNRWLFRGYVWPDGVDHFTGAAGVISLEPGRDGLVDAPEIVWGCGRDPTHLTLYHSHTHLRRVCANCGLVYLNPAGPDSGSGRNPHRPGSTGTG